MRAAVPLRRQTYLYIFLPIQVAVGLVLGGIILFSFRNPQEHQAHV